MGTTYLVTGVASKRELASKERDLRSDAGSRWVGGGAGTRRPILANAVRDSLSTRRRYVQAHSYRGSDCDCPFRSRAGGVFLYRVMKRAD
jgi:hypothetical protein